MALAEISRASKLMLPKLKKKVPMGLGLVFMPYRHISEDIRERCAVLIRGWVPDDIWDALGLQEDLLPLALQ